MTLEEFLGRKVTGFGMDLEGGYHLFFGADYDDEVHVGLSRTVGWSTEYIITERAGSAQEALEIAAACLNPEGSRD
jgi:hypothetical protein